MGRRDATVRLPLLFLLLPSPPLFTRSRAVLDRPLTIIAWHVPKLFAIGVGMEIAHRVEHSFFFPFLFPPCSGYGRCSCTFFCSFLFATILPGFIVYERVAYPRVFSPSAFFFPFFSSFLPSAIISSRLLGAPRTSHENDLEQTQFWLSLSFSSHGKEQLCGAS